MPMMNWLSTAEQIEWISKWRTARRSTSWRRSCTTDDQRHVPDTGNENMDIDWQFEVGDVVKIRIFNDPETLHPMNHPIRLHGQRYLGTVDRRCAESESGVEGHGHRAGRIDRRHPRRHDQPRRVDAPLPHRLRITDLPLPIVRSLEFEAGLYAPPLEWNDAMPMMNWLSTAEQIEWILRRSRSATPPTSKQPRTSHLAQHLVRRHPRRHDQPRRVDAPLPHRRTPLRRHDDVVHGQRRRRPVSSPARRTSHSTLYVVPCTLYFRSAQLFLPSTACAALTHV